MKPRKKLFINLIILLSSTLLTLFFLEVAARVYLDSFASDAFFLRYASFQQLSQRYDSPSNSNKLSSQKRYSPHRYLGYYPTPNYLHGKNRHNSRGFRGEEIEMPKPKGEFRIVCMGGSTTYTGHIEDYKLSYPTLLEAELKAKGYDTVKVINAGASGWSSWETLISFELRVLDLEPDMIIVYHGINDIPPRLVWPPEAYKGDNSGRRAPNQGIFMPSIFEYSTVLRVLMIRAGVTESHAALATTVDRAPPTYYGDDFREQKYNGNYPGEIFETVSAAKMLETNKPKFFARNIENIVTIANQQGIKTILASFAFSQRFTDKPHVSSEEYITAFYEMNAEVRRFAQK